ncbi:uncharacterized protein EV420DRAFT_1487963 [Desarmillaria tabescens]|uniref:Uncharacterized protein n=1 Tax=Armillaria tabescens TaxID=1929756 RepID=A0AA39J3J4_ARMTA|nr:uncharacterized protein EV420DRAFT_1487963 [Desarmillaria tabescens]KAK0435456.1 hypothetical protein EV420DRAFT_1487963 [Desarmillaria tabescens]
MATTVDKATIFAALLPPVDSTTTKKKSLSKKKSATMTTTTDFIPQQKIDTTANTSLDVVPTSPFMFSDAQGSEGDLKEALMRFWRHTYRLGEDGHFEASREMEQTGMEAADDTFQCGKEAGLEGRRAGYCNGLDEGRLEAEEGVLELFLKDVQQKR